MFIPLVFCRGKVTITSYLFLCGLSKIDNVLWNVTVN